MKFYEVRLKMADLDEAKAFYHDTLRLPVLESTADLLVLQAGGTRLVFEREAGWQGKYHFAFDVPENKVDCAAAWIADKAKIARLDGQTVFHSSPRWNAHMVYFYDPAGNILEFIGRHNRPNTSDEPFSEHSILSVSEVGIATSDVAQTVKWLCDALGVTVYDGEGSDRFSAVGDEMGLLIVVKEGRVWYPETGIAADCNPVSVTVVDEEMREFDVPGTPYHIQLGV